MDSRRRRAGAATRATRWRPARARPGKARSGERTRIPFPQTTA
ncbi:hypothetical protein C7S13_1486 [Burkholderia cepacia]|nr:hypothetical protein [Burkholderia cepacia]MDW9244643.1 hypothetical protein [Burkholderia cepacia]QOH32449.1 hypothetical protein C7S14_6247 [Burkholderia cepacia]